MDQRVARIGAVGVVLCALVGDCGRAQAQPGCPANEAAPSTIVGLVGGTDIALADGRTVRLAFLDVPDGYGDAVRSQLAVFFGESVRLRPASVAPDRWGRIAAQIFVTREGGENLSLGGHLVQSGLARVNPELAEADAGPCLAALAAAESEARRAKTGLWADPRHALRQARDTTGLLALAGSFAVVEGRVLSVGERRERTYLNFGRRWSDDTTVTIPKRTWRMMLGAGGSASAWRGRRVRVRGVVEDHDGPSIEVTSPEQIEIVTDLSR